jgi:hypothetical protein
MTSSTSTEGSLAKKVFSLAIAAYAATWAGAFVFAFRVFGMGAAMLLSWMLVLPFLIAVRMRRRWTAVRRREIVRLLVLLVLVSGGGSAFVIWHCYDLGMHNTYRAEVKFGELVRIVGEDPAFRNIELKRIPFKSFHPISQIQGTVASQADLERIRLLCDQYGFPLRPSDVSVIGHKETTNE